MKNEKETEKQYATYFRSRGVDPSMYRKARLPYYLENVFRGGGTSWMSAVDLDKICTLC